MTVVPSRENLKATLLQIAHKQMIQQPKYALHNMSAVAGELRTTLTTIAQIQAMYEDKKQTNLELIEAKKKAPQVSLPVYMIGG